MVPRQTRLGEREVDRRDLVLTEFHVVADRRVGPDRVSDIAWIETGGRNLIKQRLEGVVVVAVHKYDFEVTFGFGQRFTDSQAPKNLPRLLRPGAVGSSGSRPG